MRSFALLPCLLALAACGPRASEPAAPPAPATTGAADAGWTGRTHPEGVIEAREELMAHMEALMLPIDEMSIGRLKDPSRVRENAYVIGTMLHAVPHLFPPTTNLYDKTNPTPPTVALPAIWENFDAFYAQAEAAIQAAEALGSVKADADLPAAGARLRAGCDGCHALYLRKYEPPVVKPSDYEFDFDSALPKK